MEVNRRPFFNKHSTPQFKKKGSNKRGKWNGSSSEQSPGSEDSSDTVYRILCHSRKIGSVIGKGGVIVKALRDETQAKITVADTISGSDERVIIIYSPSTKPPRKSNINNDDEDLDTKKKDDTMELHCAAQDALLKVHDRIVEEDIVGGTEKNDDNETVVTARLLVPNNTVGCLLGRKGDVIQRLRSETGASIRVLPAEQLPACAMSTDELVQISGKPAIAKRALYEVSTLLHQNPRKDKPPSGVPVTHGGQGFHPPGPPMENIPPRGNPMWSERNSNARGMPPMPWMGGYANEPSGFGPGSFDDFPAAHGREAPSEFSMKILCSATKIGGVIGKGGSNVRQLQQETGASIHVDDISAESDERVIRVSSIEAPWNPRSRTIDAILHLQDKTSEYSDKGNITTRLLIPSSKVGCLLGQGGHVINEMRRRTQADIRVFSKEDKPKCAGEDEELVQISGNYGVAKDALAEIASRFRARCLRDTKAGTEPAPIGPGPGFGPRGNIPGGRPPPPETLGGSRSGGYENRSRGYDGRSGGYEPFKDGGREYEPHSYPAEYESRSYPAEYESRNYPAEYEPHRYPAAPSASGYPSVNSTMEARRPSHALGSHIGTGVGNTSEISGARLKLQDPYPGGPESVDIRGSSQYLKTAQIAYHQSFSGSSGQISNPQQSMYQNNYNPQQGASYPDYNSSQTSFHGTPNNPQQPPYDYQNYHNNSNNSYSTQHGQYNMSAPSSYQY